MENNNMVFLNTTKPLIDALNGSFNCEGFHEVTEESLLVNIHMWKNNLIGIYSLYKFDFVTYDDDLYNILRNKKFHIYKMESYDYKYTLPSAKFTNYCDLEKILRASPWSTYDWKTDEKRYTLEMFLLIPNVDTETISAHDAKGCIKCFLKKWPVIFNFTEDGLIIKYNGQEVFRPALKCKDEILGTKKIPINKDDSDKDELDKMTLDGAIKYYEREAKEQYELYKVCPWSDGQMCTGMKDCRSLEYGKDKGCLKLTKEYDQLVIWLKDYRVLCNKQDDYTE